MEHENEHQSFVNPHRSKGTKIAWKRHHNSYMAGIRKRERDNMNQSFFDVAQELKEMLLQETKLQTDNVFELNCELLFDTISGGVSFKINKDDGDISFSTLLNETGTGNYRLENGVSSEEEYKALYNDLKDEFSTLLTTFDEGVKQILARHGLRETK